MQLIDYLIIAILAVILGGAVLYIWKTKKRGGKCIGCPSASTCSGKCGSCAGCCNAKK